MNTSRVKSACPTRLWLTFEQGLPQKGSMQNPTKQKQFFSYQMAGVDSRKFQKDK